MDKNTLGPEFWESQYKADTTGWDMGRVSPPIKEYIDQLKDKDIRILIPGCGNTYEAEYLLQQGFTNVTVVDIAPTLVNRLKEKFKDNPNIKIILGDFFEHQGEYDLIFEQTFFCALDENLRPHYRDKMLKLLASKGKLVGLLFNIVFEQQGPPFGGTREEYENIFKGNFEFKTFAPSYNSHPKRQGNELFMILRKR